ncbi:hypothetical protein RF11_09538 [Thelohanellus kitauei]|uniref:Uncharacterized protein n=1 Tax=Thelohanellus kitauei TaxID=669202 RepID=A0A0C2MNF2_THEKT|nr:hypothetical protein RF11_09538 [Thelohanellus kitauei]
MARKARKYISNEAHELISIVQQRGNTVKSIAETLKICRKSVSNNLKVNEEQQTCLPVEEKCRNTRVQQNAIFTNMKQTIYHGIACENSLILPEVQDIFREQSNTS